MEVACTVQLDEEEPRVSNKDFDEDCGVQVKIWTKNSRYKIICSLRLCSVFCGEIYFRMSNCVRFCRVIPLVN